MSRDDPVDIVMEPTPPSSVVQDGKMDYGTIPGKLVAQQRYNIAESAKMGIPGAAFLILNKMIGTGSMDWPLSPSWIIIPLNLPC